MLMVARLVDSSELEMDYQETGRPGPLTTSTSVRVCVPGIKTLYLRQNGCHVDL